MIAATAFLVRLIYLIELSNRPGFSIPMIDEKFFWLWADEIINKSFWGESAYFRAPLYGYFLAILHFVTSGSIFWMKFLQLLLTGGTAIFIYRIANNIFNHKSGLLAGFIYAFYGTLIMYETMFLIPVLFLFLISWGLYRYLLLDENSPVLNYVFTGILFGLAALARPNVLLVIPVFMLWSFFKYRHGGGLLKQAIRPLLLMAGVALMILPVTIRNKIVTDEFVLISSQGGINFYLGNNPVADGLTMIMPEVDLDEAIGWDQFEDATIRAATREAGKALTPAEASSFWAKKTVDFIKNNPGDFIELLDKKIIYLLNGFENSDNADIYYQRNKSTLYSILLWDKFIYFPYGLLLPLVFVGIILCGSHRKKLWPLYLFLLAYIPSIVLFLVTARHRLPLIPVLIIIAAGGLVYLFENFKKISMLKKVLTAVLFLVLVIVLNKPYFDLDSSTGFQIHFNNGIKFEKANDLIKAEAEYKTADSIYPYSATLVNNLAYTQYRLNKYNLAESNYIRSITLNPDYSAAYNNYGLLLIYLNKDDSAKQMLYQALKTFNPDRARPNEQSRIYLNLADLYDYTGLVDSAEYYYNQSIEAGDNNYKALSKAAAFYAKNKRYGKADTLFLKSQALTDLSATDEFNWSISFLERKQYQLTLKHLYRATRLDPALYQSYYLLAVTYYELKAPIDSVHKYLDLTLKYDSNYKAALQMKERLK